MRKVLPLVILTGCISSATDAIIQIDRPDSGADLSTSSPDLINKQAADLAPGTPDLAKSPTDDLSTARDLATAPQHDMAPTADLARPVDLARTVDLEWYPTCGGPGQPDGPQYPCGPDVPAPDPQCCHNYCYSATGQAPYHCCRPKGVTCQSGDQCCSGYCFPDGHCN